MSPAAASAKAGAFDIATLFTADKAATAEAAANLATLAKKEGVEFFGQIGLNDAIVKVGDCFASGYWRLEAGNLGERRQNF